jgi:hypothetical protein
LSRSIAASISSGSLPPRATVISFVPRRFPWVRRDL